MLGRGARERTSDDDLSPEAIQWCEWEAQPADEGWLVSYADMLSVILAMVVLLLGRMVMANAPAGVSSVGSRVRSKPRHRKPACC